MYMYFLQSPLISMFSKTFFYLDIRVTDTLAYFPRLSTNIWNVHIHNGLVSMKKLHVNLVSKTRKSHGLMTVGASSGSHDA